MRQILAAIALLLAAVWPARADNVMSCANQPSFACATGADTITGPLTFDGASPIVLEGATPDAFETFIVVADPTTPDKTLTIPNADTATAQAVSCGAGNHVATFSATTGAFTCTADAGGTPKWNAITDPDGNAALGMAAFTTTFTWGATTGAGVDMMVLRDTTGNTGTGDVLLVNTTASSAARPLKVTAGGTSNGMQMSTAGVLAKIGTGSVEADNVVCTTCVGTTDVANNAIDGTKIAIAAQATGDTAYYDGTDWVVQGTHAANTVLHGNGAAAPTYSAVVSADITDATITGADISDTNFLIWNTACAGDPCSALSPAPRSISTLLVAHHGMILRSCGTTCSGCGANEYAVTTAGTVVDFCDASQGVNTGADQAYITYES